MVMYDVGQHRRRFHSRLGALACARMGENGRCHCTTVSSGLISTTNWTALIDPR
jgi:hypothetical protein